MNGFRRLKFLSVFCLGMLAAVQPVAAATRPPNIIANPTPTTPTPLIVRACFRCSLAIIFLLLFLAELSLHYDV
jgi:hypothetical protein